MATPPEHIVLQRDDIADGGVLGFKFEASGWPTGGFVYRAGDRFHAWVNRCKHLPLTLDLGTGDFLTPDASELLCSNHGARFDPTTGLCTWGPCKGLSLEPIPLDDSDPEILVLDISGIDEDRSPRPDLS